MPNTEVSLKLARELEVSVDELFSLASEQPTTPKVVRSELLSAAAPVPGQAVQVCRLGDRLISVPVNASPYFLSDADAVISKPRHGTGRADIVVSEEDSFAERLIVAGCDPAIGLLAQMVERTSGVQVLCAAASSKLALSWLQAGKVHIAGTHLRDSRTGEFNVPIVRREFPDQDFTIVTFASWEEGFVTAAGNPKQIKTVADLARRTVRFVSREAGSGSRALLDALLEETGMPGTKVAGYDRVADGHLAAAYAVRAGEADCCIATGSAARSFGLDFIPLQGERYDFVLRREALGLPAVQKFMDVLQKAGLRRKLEVFAGYDTSKTGSVVA